MKKILSFVMLVGVMFGGCCPVYNTYVYIENETSQNITVRAYGAYEETSGGEKSFDAGDELFYIELSVSPHTRQRIGKDCYGCGIFVENASRLLRRYADSIRIGFVDRSIVFFRDSLVTQVHSPYSSASFHMENFEKELNREYADAVYVVTSEDYDRAK